MVRIRKYRKRTITVIAIIIMSVFMVNAESNYLNLNYSEISESVSEYNMYALTAAHKKLPLGSIVRVTNNSTNETVLLKINDRGPYVKKRIIDLSYTSAQKISGATNPNVKIRTMIISSVILMNCLSYVFLLK